jgi:NADH:ubiquinone reductase (non-electrogenic)
MDIFSRRGINLQTKKAVREVSPKSVTLTDGQEVPYGLLVWSTGLAPSDLVRGLKASKDRTQRLVTNSQLNILDQDGLAIPHVVSVVVPTVT